MPLPDAERAVRDEYEQFLHYERLLLGQQDSLSVADRLDDQAIRMALQATQLRNLAKQLRGEA